jgi:hypothetical protein
MSILNILVGKIDYIQVVFMYSNSLYYITLLHVFTCLYNYIDIVLCTAYFVFVLTFTHPGLYWIYGNKDDDKLGSTECNEYMYVSINQSIFCSHRTHHIMVHQ